VADDLSLEIVGANTLVPDLDRLGGRLAHDGTGAMRRVAAQLVPQVRSRMPVVTGALVRSVSVIDDADQGTVDVGASVVYAGWIEFGGSRGRPYLPGGRYLVPTVAAASGQVGRAVNQQSTSTIGGFPWSHTS